MKQARVFVGDEGFERVGRGIPRVTCESFQRLGLGLIGPAAAVVVQQGVSRDRGLAAT